VFLCATVTVIFNSCSRSRVARTRRRGTIARALSEGSIGAFASRCARRHARGFVRAFTDSDVVIGDVNVIFKKYTSSAWFR
jgi:hypothetical protein